MRILIVLRNLVLIEGRCYLISLSAYLRNQV
ncbi:hypothetical protein [Bacillus phage FI_KG-Lek]|nr:hypothetical protein [Bacillus phage FI_KG-Lek]